VHIEGTKGATIAQELVINDKRNGAVMNLERITSIQAYAKARLTEPDERAVQLKIAMTRPRAGTVELVFPPETNETMPGRGVWDVRVVHEDGTSEIVEGGTYRLHPRVSPRR
jgi:hypothetical protein